jgi:hypothetical protein
MPLTCLLIAGSAKVLFADMSWTRPVGGALLPGGNGRLPRHLVALFAFGFALVAYSLAHLGPHANGLIAVFVCAITLGIRRDDVRHAVETPTTDVAEMVKLAVFVVFGALSARLDRHFRRALDRGP